MAFVQKLKISIILESQCMLCFFLIPMTDYFDAGGMIYDSQMSVIIYNRRESLRICLFASLLGLVDFVYSAMEPKPISDAQKCANGNFQH